MTLIRHIGPSARGASVYYGLSVLCGLWLALTTAEAATWYVQANPGHAGDGTTAYRPFSSLQDVEAHSLPEDTIFVVPSPDPLDGGMQLKDGQRLIGLGPAVTIADPHRARAHITNTTSARYDGDAIRLAKHNLVHNIHIDNAFRSAILGINTVATDIRNNLITNTMAAHDLLAIEAEWPAGYILFQQQTNHFGGITLVACGPDAPVVPRQSGVQSVSYCEFLASGTWSPIAKTEQVVIAGNVIRDSNSDGIIILNDTDVVAHYRVTDNVVRDLSQGLPDPREVGIIDHVVRSRAFTILTIDASTSTVQLRNFYASNLAPVGAYASDGAVLLTAGVNPLVNAEPSDLVVLNPLLTGEAANADSIEITHRSRNGVLNVDITRAELRDPASTNIKILDVNASNTTYNVTVTDSVLSNSNPTGIADAQMRFFAVGVTDMNTLNLVVKEVQISGLGQGLGIENTANVQTLHVLVEHASLADLTREGIVVTHAANRTLGTAIIDLGGGPLGSEGRNRFVHNGAFDVSVTNNMTTAPIEVFASENFWGGGAPVIGTDVLLSDNVTFTAPTFLTTDPAP
jgi:hypothetical protein